MWTDQLIALEAIIDELREVALMEVP